MFREYNPPPSFPRHFDFEREMEYIDVIQENGHYDRLRESTRRNRQARVLRIRNSVLNISKCGKMSLEEFKSMMEKLGVPQTHLSLKSMIREVDQDNDGMITFREFMSIFRKFAAGELEKDSGLETLAQKLEVNVNEVGVGGAKSFFEAKISAARRDSQYGRDVFLEEEEKKQDLEELKSKQQAFKAKAAMFETR
jgi:hypothetical protein